MSYYRRNNNYTSKILREKDYHNYNTSEYKYKKPEVKEKEAKNFISENKQKISKPPRPFTALEENGRTQSRTDIAIDNYLKDTIKVKRPASATPKTDQSTSQSSKTSKSLNEISYSEESELVNTQHHIQVDQSAQEIDFNEDNIRLSEDADPHSRNKQKSTHEDSDEEELMARDTRCRFNSLVNKRSYLKFRPIYDYCQPTIYNYFDYYYKCSQDTNLVKWTLEDNGFREYFSDRTEPSIIWTSGSSNSGTYAVLNRYQKINHFPNSFELTRKDSLYRNILKMQKQYGSRHYNFIPLSYVMPNDNGLLATEMYKNPSKWYIGKPTNKSQGKGIFLTNKLADLKYRSQYIISEYIDNPLLVDDFKFDLRIYVILTSLQPLKIFLYDEGLVRFATEKYTHPSDCSGEVSMFAHLTNYSINKFNENFTENEDAEEDAVGNKWSYSAFIKFLEENEIDTLTLKAEIEDIIVKSIISAEGQMSMAFNNNVTFRNNCFEILGYDIMLDDTMKPYLIEINQSPSLGCGSPLDLKIKGQLLRDTFNLIGIISNETRFITTKYDKNPQKPLNYYSEQYMGNSKATQKQIKDDMKENWDHLAQVMSNEYGLDINVLKREERHIIKDFEEELSRMENMKLIFPSAKYDHYRNYFDEERKLNELLSTKFTKRKSKYYLNNNRKQLNINSKTEKNLLKKLY